MNTQKIISTLETSKALINWCFINCKVIDPNLSDTFYKIIPDQISFINSSLSEIMMDQITDRELQVFKMIQQGFTNKEIAKEIKISHRTVDVHRDRFIAKIGAKNTAHAVSIAIEKGILKIKG